MNPSQPLLPLSDPQLFRALLTRTTRLLNFLRSTIHLTYALILFMLSPYLIALSLACSYFV